MEKGCRSTVGMGVGGGGRGCLESLGEREGGGRQEKKDGAACVCVCVCV